MRGYDPVEVDTFIDLIADKYQELLEENEKLTKQNLVLESELGNFRDVEKTLKQTLRNVQENSAMSKENSAKEAVLIKKEAELAAAQMLEKTRLKVHKMKEEIVTLQNQKYSFITRLKHVLSSQMELLDVLEMDDVDVSKLKDKTKPSLKPNVTKSAPTAIKQGKTATEVKKSVSTTDSAKKSDEKEEKTHGKDLFNDIFGENLDVDDFIK